MLQVFWVGLLPYDGYPAATWTISWFPLVLSDMCGICAGYLRPIAWGACMGRRKCETWMDDWSMTSHGLSISLFVVSVISYSSSMISNSLSMASYSSSMMSYGVALVVYCFSSAWTFSFGLSLSLVWLVRDAFWFIKIHQSFHLNYEQNRGIRRWFCIVC